MISKKNKTNDSQSLLSLDALMDILTCIIGILLLLVVFAILQSMSVKITTKLPRMNISDKGHSENNTDIDLKMLTVYCQNNKFLFAMNWEDMLQDLFGDIRQVTFETLPEITRNANDNNVRDDFFSYRIYYRDYQEWDRPDGGYRNFRTYPVLIVKKRNPFLTAKDSTFLTDVKELLSKYDTTNYWLNIYVDTSSIETFRKIRKTCDDMGFIIGWIPSNLSMSFPDTISIMERNNIAPDDKPPGGGGQNLKN